MADPAPWRFEWLEAGADWSPARPVRHQVFVLGQDCPPEEEWDEYDATSRHLLARIPDGIVGVARWREVERAGEAWAKLERFAVLEGWRGRGLGRALVEETIRDAVAHGHRRLVMHAQDHLVGFYRGFGFGAVGERFTEAGIPHRIMERSLS